MTRSGRIAQPPPPTVRPFEGAASHEEVRREDDEVLRQLHSREIDSYDDGRKGHLHHVFR